MPWRLLGEERSIDLNFAFAPSGSGNRFLIRSNIANSPMTALSVREIGAVGFVASEAWSVSESHGIAMMTGPVPQQNQPCLIAIGTTPRAGGDPAAQGKLIVNNAFGDRQPGGQYSAAVDIQLPQSVPARVCQGGRIWRSRRGVGRGGLGLRSDRNHELAGFGK